MGDIASGIGDALGFGSGGDTASAGNKFAASGVNLLNPATEAQANTAYGQTQSGLAQQQAFIQALQAQNGVQNQSNIYNQLGGIAAGQGPNPAQAMLAQQTGANTANQAALMAGQRGAGANTGLIARQAAMQGGNLQQQAVGQGATMQANQSLNALNMQGGLATQQVGQQAAANNAYNQAALQQQGNILGAIGQQNQANVGMRSNQNQANAGVANTVAQGQQGMMGSVFGGIGGALGLAHGGQIPHYDDGGGVMAPSTPTLSGQAALSNDSQARMAQDPNAPQSSVGKFFNSQNSMAPSPFIGGPSNPGAQQLSQGMMQFTKGIGKGISGLLKGGGGASAGAGSEGAMAGGPMDAIGVVEANPEILAAAHGGKVPAMVSPGEAYIPPNKVKDVAKGEDPRKAGEVIPGKAKVKGDSLKNDTVSKTLDEGGFVIPRSIMESKDASRKAAEFVKAHLKQKGRLPKKL